MNDDARVRELRRLVPAGFDIHARKITRSAMGDTAYDQLVAFLLEAEVADPGMDYQNLAFIFHRKTLVTIVNLDQNIEEQIEADTCLKHGVFCCPSCINLEPMDY